MRSINIFKVGIQSLSLGVATLIMSLFFNQMAFAQEEDSGTTTEESATSETQYSHTVSNGDNLTKIIRKSVLQYNDQESIGLSNAEVIYVEANIAVELECVAVHPGQEITVSQSMIKKYSDATDTLTDSQISNLEMYAANADFALAGVGEGNVAGTSSVATNEQGDNDQAGGSEDSGDNEGNDDRSEDDDEDDDDKDSDSDSSVIWWIVAAGAVTAGWWFIRKRK